MDDTKEAEDAQEREDNALMDALLLWATGLDRETKDGADKVEQESK